MRLIDADALEEEIRAKDIMGGLNYSLFIRNAPTIEMRRPDKWIPVSESIQEKQANADKIDAVYIDGFKAGYSQARFDLEQQPCERFEWGIDGNVYKITKAKDGKEICQQVCKDAISKQARFEILTKYNLEMSKIAEDMNKLPPVTPQQKYGKWIVVSDGYGESAYICECSECKDTVWVYKDADRKWNYCPSCGAKMQESEE